VVGCKLRDADWAAMYDAQCNTADWTDRFGGHALEMSHLFSESFFLMPHFLMPWETSIFGV